MHRFCASCRRHGQAALLAVCIVTLAAPGLPAQTIQGPTLQGDSTHPAEATNWVETRLYFGLGPANHPHTGITAAAWRRFLDGEVTPRFPSGLSVSDLYGQWQGQADTRPSRLRSKLVILVYPATAENARRVDAIRTAWKQQTGDQSVLRVTTPADVSF